MLLAREVPPFGGDTLFANMYLAFDSLSPGLKKLLEGLKAVNSSTKADASMTREDIVKSSGKDSKKFTCRFSWQPGSLALWDNRCAQHNPVNDYHGYRRLMHRITLAGDVPA